MGWTGGNERSGRVGVLLQTKGRGVQVCARVEGVGGGTLLVVVLGGVSGSVDLLAN